MPQLSQRPRRTADNDPEEGPSRRRRLVQGGSRRRPADEEEEEEYEEEDRAARSQKRQRRREAEEEDDNDEDDEEEEEDDGVTQTQIDRHQLYDDLLAKKLVRYALACEPRRVLIRRQAIKEQVLENQGKHFKNVFPIAQEQLQAILGMKMVEWPARDETTMSVRERRKALKTKKTASSTAAAARADRYVLLSTLPDDYRASVFAPVPADPATTTSTALHAIPPAPDVAYVGLVTMVVALITLSGGSLPHADLEKYLAMLYGGRQGPVRADAELLPVAAALGDHIDDDDGGGGGGHGVDATQGNDADGASTQGGTLQYLIRQGYLVRVMEVSSTAEGRGPVGGRSAGGSPKVTWYVGPRGRLEIGAAEVAAVVRHIYGPAAGADLERRLQTSLRATNDAEGGQQGEAMQET